MNETVETITAAYEIHPLFGILTTIIIAVLSYLVFETRSLKRQLAEQEAKYLAIIEAKDKQLIEIQEDSRAETKSMMKGVVQAYTDQTKALIKFEGLFRDLFNRDIAKLNEITAQIKELVSQNNK